MSDRQRCQQRIWNRNPRQPENVPCSRFAMPGSATCWQHGGDYFTIRALRVLIGMYPADAGNDDELVRLYGVASLAGDPKVPARSDPQIRRALRKLRKLDARRAVAEKPDS